MSQSRHPRLAAHVSVWLSFLHSLLAPIKFPGHSCAGGGTGTTAGLPPPPSRCSSPLALAQNGAAWEGLQLVVSMDFFFNSCIFVNECFIMEQEEAPILKLK